MFDEIYRLGERTVKVIGVIATIGTALFSTGVIPIPATQAWVSRHIELINGSIAALKIITIEGQLDNVSQSRAFLVNEMTATEYAIKDAKDKKDRATEVIWVQKAAEIRSNLDRLTRRQDKLEADLSMLKGH